MTESTLEVSAFAPLRIPERSLRDDLRAVEIVWRRELIRFFRDRARLVASLLQPVLYLFVFGTGLSPMFSRSGGPDLRTFLFPGVTAMSVLFTCFFSAGSLVWDREFGFFREMMVAPVRRWAIVLGKCLGGTTAGTFQGLVMLVLGGFAGLPYSPGLVLTLIAEIALVAFGVTALGVLMAARVKSMQAFMALIQIVLMPLFFLSGALFPLSGLPSWLRLLTRLDPLTYAVDPMRRAVFAHLPAGAAGQLGVTLGVTWGSWLVPIWVELAILAGIAAAAICLAVAQFSRPE